MTGEERVDVGNLYRVLRALEEQGLVTSEWDETLPGPAKRTYELTAARGSSARPRALGRRARRETREPESTRFLVTIRRRGGDHAPPEIPRAGARPPLGARFYARENVLERLDEYQRDLEQELADVSELIKRLRENDESRQTRAADDV